MKDKQWSYSSDVAIHLCFLHYDLGSVDECVINVWERCLGILFCPVSDGSKASRVAKPKDTSIRKKWCFDKTPFFGMQEYCR